MTENRQDGWIKHEGGECPVPAGTEVNLWLRNGEVAWTLMPEMCAWMQDGDPLDVVGYRVVEPATGKTDGASAKDNALTALCETIEATGGLVKDDSAKLVPAGDEDWNDLAEAYILACRALGREPMIDTKEN